MPVALATAIADLSSSIHPGPTSSPIPPIIPEAFQFSNQSEEHAPAQRPKHFPGSRDRCAFNLRYMYPSSSVISQTPWRSPIHATLYPSASSLFDCWKNYCSRDKSLVVQYRYTVKDHINLYQYILKYKE